MTHALPQTTTPKRIGLVGNVSCGIAVEPTCTVNRPSTTAVVCSMRARVRSSIATKKRAAVGPNGGPSP
jgi:hypothetical protein